MASGKKRKDAPTSSIQVEADSVKRRFVESNGATVNVQEQQADVEIYEAPASDSDAVVKAQERMERFKALKARQSQSKLQNLKETRLEAHRLATDPNLINSINRKHAVASHKLLKADAIAAGEDFERKRAWDWTVEDTEKWNKRVQKKEKHKANVAFQDYTQEANKTYKRQMRGFQPDLKAYVQEKVDRVQEAAAKGGLEIMEMEDGELIAVDKDGSFQLTNDGTEHLRNKPRKEAVDRLVADLSKAEENRLRKQKSRNRDQDDDGDVTYINKKNKQFNDKLKRFYDKYTGDIRESFERGTAI